MPAAQGCLPFCSQEEGEPVSVLGPAPSLDGFILTDLDNVRKLVHVLSSLFPRARKLAWVVGVDLPSADPVSVACGPGTAEGNDPQGHRTSRANGTFVPNLCFDSWLSLAETQMWPVTLHGHRL